METGKVSTPIGDREFIIETGQLAKLANGAALVTYGDSVVLTTIVAGSARENNYGGDDDMLPLTVEYKEKTSAAGKIPGGFFKREGRPSTKEILTMRMIDRPTRPLFPDGFKSEIQIMAMVLSADKNHDPDILAMNGASMALCLSGLPFKGPIGAVRVGYLNNQFIANPSYEEIKTGQLELVISGSADSVMMVEGFASEVSEQTLIDAIEFGHKHIKEIVAIQTALLKQVPPKAFDWQPDTATADKTKKLYQAIKKEYGADLEKRLQTKSKQERSAAVKELREKISAQYLKTAPVEEQAALPKLVGKAFAEVEHEVVRKMITQNKRVDGRGLKDIRAISGKVGFLPRTHGSALFTRGETQALVTVTLGSDHDAQIIDGLSDEYSKTFMLHYNFPPFSTGEVKRLSGPSRREIGHGNLAEHAVKTVLPSAEQFPYTIRIVSDILQSNGSSSMATVCGSSMCLMDAAVPITKPVAGIAMGLIKEDKEISILSDILGSEDKHGDMDFKVAGTRDGINAVQMDIKTDGITPDIMARALAQAREGRLFILDRMAEIIAQPRAEIAASAPRVLQIKINPEKIGAVIGPGGKHIKKLEADTNATVEIKDDGTILIYAENTTMAEKARQIIADATTDPEVGTVYEGPVTGIKDFGAFVEIMPGREGMVHISELAYGFVKSVSDVLKLGDIVKVKLIAAENDRLRLSIKALLPVPEQQPGSPGEGQRPDPFNRDSGGGYRPSRDSGGRPPSRGRFDGPRNRR